MNRLEQLLEYFREDPGDPFTRFALASEYWKRGVTDRARILFEELIETDPTYVGTYYHLGKLYEALGRPEDAQRVYEAGILVARRMHDFHARSELQGALLTLRGIAQEEDNDW